MLKGLIVLLMIALLITLGAGLYFLMIDQGDVKKTRLVNSLRVRVGIAGTLMALIVYGVATGQLGHPAPGTRVQPQKLPNKKGGINPPLNILSSSSDDVDEDKEKDPNHIDEVPIPA